MAKRASRGAAKASQKKARKNGAAVKTEPTGIDAGTGPTQRRQLGRRSTDCKVDRNLERHFSHLSSATREHAVVDGHNLRWHIRNAIKNPPTGVRAGCTVWSSIAEKFVASECKFAALRVQAADLPVSEALLHAVAQCVTGNFADRDLDALPRFFENCRVPLNEAEVVGVMKAVLTPKNLMKLEFDRVVISIMQHIATFGLHKRYIAAMAAARDTFDRVLCREWSFLKKGGCRLSTFLSTHLCVELLCDASDLTLVQADAGHKFINAMPSLGRLVSSSSVGRMLFAPILDSVAAEGFSTLCAEAIMPLSSSAGALSDEDVCGVEEALNEIARVHGDNSALKLPREVAIPWLVGDVKIVVNSPSEEVALRLSASLKRLSVGYKNGLAMLPYERWILESRGEEATKEHALNQHPPANPSHSSAPLIIL